MCVCMYISIYLYIYIYIQIYIHTYIYTYTYIDIDRVNPRYAHTHSIISNSVPWGSAQREVVRDNLFDGPDRFYQKMN